MCAAVIAGCDKSTSQPTAPPPTTRAVAATVEDTTGARLSGETVWALRLDVGEAVVGTTDASGVAHFTLEDGRWCMSTVVRTFPTPVLVAGATGQVRANAGQPDTVLYRLVARPESIIRGKVTLTGQTAHAGTIVGAAELPTFTTTEADGSYELGRLPPGTWSGLATHVGYQGKLFDLVVPFVGDTIATGPVVLLPGPVP